MQDSKSFQSYLALVEDRHMRAKEFLLQLLITLVSSTANADAKNQRCKATVQALAELDALFAADHKPGWLPQLIAQVNKYMGANGDEEVSRNLVSTLLSNHKAIFEGKILEWVNSPAPPIADFDAIYRETFDASQLPTLFDQLTKLLETIIDSGAIDSRRAINSLQKLVELLKQNCNGSYHSARSSFHVAVAVAKNVLAEYADDSSLGPIIRGVQKTLDEMGMSWREVGHNMLSRIATVLPFKLDGIGQQPVDRIAFGGEVIDGQAKPAEPPRIADTPYRDAPEEPAA